MNLKKLSLMAMVLCIAPQTFADKLELDRRDPAGIVLRDPLLDDYQGSVSNECLADPTDAELAEARDKFQKWVNEKLPKAKDTDEIAKEIMTKFDTNSDKKITSAELESLLEEAGIGNWITRSCWATGIIDHFEKESPEGDKDKALTEEEISAGLKKIGITAPPPPPPPAS